MHRLRELRLQCGYTQEQLAERLGLKKAAVCKYELGRVNIPQDALIALSELFSVSIDYLLGHSEHTGGNAVRAVSVPVLGRVHAGAPILAEENIEEYVCIAESDVMRGDCFFMDVVGDCMTDAHIPEGSRILVQMQSRVENGQIAVVRLEEEVVLRRVKWIKSQLILYPANPNYEPMIIDSGEVEIIGRVVEVRIREL